MAWLAVGSRLLLCLDGQARWATVHTVQDRRLVLTVHMFKKAKTGRCSTFCTVGGIMHSINYCTVLYQ